jgi:hypothetical protein
MNDKKKWWDALEPQWKKAYNETVLNKGPVEAPPTEEELDYLLTSPVLRLVGPGGSHPNMSFQLTNLSGLPGMKDLEILVVTDHQINDTQDLASLTRLKSLFLANNGLKSLKGLEKLAALEQLHVNVNLIEDLSPISQLSSLNLLNCAHNQISVLDIPKSVKKLFCLPNDELPDAEIIRIERNKGLLCRRG